MDPRVFETDGGSDRATQTPEPPFSDPCVIHSPMSFHGGGEQYALELAEILDATLYTYECKIDYEHEVDVVEFDENYVDRLVPKLPFSGYWYILAYESFSVPTHHDAVITSGDAAKAVIHRPNQHRYHLLHTPTRWLYDQTHSEHRVTTWPLNWVQRQFRSYMRVLDESTIPRIDDFVVNSDTVGRRLETYYRREPTSVIYPPVDTSSFEQRNSEGYLFHVGRLEDAKAVDEIIEAVNGTEFKLKIAGSGSKEGGLRELAQSNVELLGFVSESRKRELLSRCDALVFNARAEDFGIVPIEAMAAGKPVVGVDEGFTRHQIEDGVNGILYERGIDNLRAAIERMYQQEWKAGEIQRIAEQYDIEVFRRKWYSLLYPSDPESP